MRAWFWLSTNNCDSATTLQVDDSPIKHFLLKFDVTGINSQTVTNAKLCLYNVDGASAGGDPSTGSGQRFHHVSDDTWQEETVTWNNAPAADTQVLASLGAVSPNTWYEVDLTSHVTGDGTYSLRVSDSVGGADYSSKEGTNDPKLLVAVGGATPQSCSGTATATPTSGATNTPTQTPTPGPSPTPTSTFAPIFTPTATQPPPGAFNNATFVYDGDGKRVKSTFNGTTTTYFVGAHYEVTGSTITKYYYAGAQRIAMRTNGTLNYLLGDHLGSTSLITDSAGNKTNEQRYKAWGETRYTFGNEKTNYQYTGQFSYTSDFGLMFYNARWYDPALGRFAQADTIIPSGVQGYDRYAYTLNNPLSNNDPSGHSTCSTVSNQYAKEGCENWSPENEDYDPCAFNSWDCSGPIDWSNATRLVSRPIVGLHIGISGNIGIAVEDYAYIQGDILFDYSSGAFYGMGTAGSGGYLGTPNGLGGQLYAGTTEVHGIPGNATSGEVQDLLGGENVDAAIEVGADAGVDVSGSAGLSLDVNPATGGFQETSAGQMYAIERSGSIGLAPIPTILNVGIEGGRSYSNASFLYQIPWWPAFLP